MTTVDLPPDAPETVDLALYELIDSKDQLPTDRKTGLLRDVANVVSGKILRHEGETWATNPARFADKVLGPKTPQED